MPMGRLNVSMKDDVIRMLEELAEQTGKTVSSIVSESASLYIESLQMGLRTEDVIRAFKIMSIIKEIDAVPVPSRLLDFLITASTRANEEEALAKWYERGLVVGNILRKYAPDIRHLAQFINANRALIPLDLFEVSEDRDRITVIVSGVGYSRESAKSTAEGLKGLLKAFGYEVVESEFSEGFVKVTSTPSEEA
ncbi:hypothetical protein GCM10007108_13580 [Thermogymnomonas acidicola]|uniref:Uncharacterized protein n=1 Tax=Thermogymnomonas acidicola TaxID=399579 RepID=A0AA37BT35_9ARCH|nr:hypothetical protein [Thermogymnomonas acidicola]GGM76772.1 hypothetical protein GCM10007108_13580 [Thermogymnomonas acidicola]